MLQDATLAGLARQSMSRQVHEVKEHQSQTTVLLKIILYALATSNRYATLASAKFNPLRCNCKLPVR